MNPRRYLRDVSATVATALAAVALFSGGSAQACALDNVPSLTADGTLVRPTTDPPTTAAQLQTYAPVTLPHSYVAGRAMVFTEIRREVAKSLVPAVMARPWRWVFGDGTTATGWTAHHAYAHPERRRIDVEAYWPPTKQWISFDQVTITIAPAARR